ncbi:hypothetical protein [Gimesia fumaroli]|uniref:Uncharacterized protein n=1 Tax=Gimesia fumaroli TaxID=2527976 RepID=A0A518II10_9PLAN|nr:hypothetical protein [Gimesia fumaroli]QDV52725.1 hypothetical protein Enr17x_47920 [Gimesia fumaroli]
MPWERTLLINFVGEPDAPTKSVKAYLSNIVFQMLYAMPTLPLTIRLYLKDRSSSIFGYGGRNLEPVYKLLSGFGVFAIISLLYRYRN